MNRLKYILFTSFIIAIPFCMSGQQTGDENAAKPRVIITCDPELDDLNSLIRLLLFSADFQVEGLIYASSQYHWKGDGRGTRWYVPAREYSGARGLADLGPQKSWRWTEGERFIDDAVETYEKVYPNLKIHHPGYPAPAYLKSKIRVGNVEFEGDFSKDSPGSELIKNVVLDDNPAPVFINAWGGASTIARALKSIQDIYENTEQWNQIKEKINKKVILCLSGDQDDTFAKYIKPFWKEIRQMQMSAMTVRLTYNAQAGLTGDKAVYYSAGWMQKNISSKGPFGKMYRVWGDGDTYCYLNLIDNGLRGHEDLSYGGWCGATRELPDFTDAVFNGLAARLNWSVSPNYMDANHEPTITGVLNISATAGEKVKLKYTVADPDKNTVSVKWWQYKSGAYKNNVFVDNPASANTTFTVPADVKSGDKIHWVLEATDNGIPPLKRYHRVIITII